MYTFDTNAIIYYIKNDDVAVRQLDSIFERNTWLYVSTISEIELFGFREITNNETIEIEKFLSAVIIVPLDSPIARIASKLHKEFGLKIPDSAIAATALYTNTTLVTRNVRDFKKVAGLNILKI